MNDIFYVLVWFCDFGSFLLLLADLYNVDKVFLYQLFKKNTMIAPSLVSVFVWQLLTHATVFQHEYYDMTMIKNVHVIFTHYFILNLSLSSTHTGVSLSWKPN